MEDKGLPLTPSHGGGNCLRTTTALIMYDVNNISVSLQSVGSCWRKHSLPPWGEGPGIGALRDGIAAEILLLAYRNE